MELTVFWTQFAEDKLDDLIAYYSSVAGFQMARELAIAIVNRSLLLERNPFIGSKEPLLSNFEDDLRYLVFKNYKIIYRVKLDKKMIEVVNLFDCRQNPTKISNIEYLY